MSDDDERRCALGPACRSFEVVDGRRLPARIEAAVGVCGPCRSHLARCARDLPAAWCRLLAAIGENRSPDRTQARRARPGSRVPINLDSDALMRDIVAALNEAAGHVAGQLNVRQSAIVARSLRRGWSTSNTQDYRMALAASDLVSGAVDRLLDADGLSLALRLSELHRRTRLHLGDVAQRERQHLPCPKCGAGALVKETQDLRGRQSTDGVETPQVIRCLACERVWGEAEYRWLSTMVLSEREESDVLRWLLAEAQWRLSRISEVAALMREDGARGVRFDAASYATAIEDYLPEEAK